MAEQVMLGFNENTGQKLSLSINGIDHDLPQPIGKFDVPEPTVVEPAQPRSIDVGVFESGYAVKLLVYDMPHVVFIHRIESPESQFLAFSERVDLLTIVIVIEVYMVAAVVKRIDDILIASFLLGLDLFSVHITTPL
jgi:hypothetical protein